VPSPSIFQVSRLSGCRLIEVAWPAQPSVAELRDFVFALYDLWDSEVDTPSVTINDLRAVESISPEQFEVIRIIMARMRMHSTFVAGSFVVGDNAIVRTTMTSALEASKRPLESLCRTRGEAISYLRSAIAQRESAAE
jgi:hypothetical protein